MWWVYAFSLMAGYRHTMGLEEIWVWGKLLWFFNF